MRVQADRRSGHTLKNILAYLLVACAPAVAQNDSAMLRKIYDQYLTNSSCYPNLAYLTGKIGGRLSGSPQAAKAVEWAAKAMKAAGADTVILQPCVVPRWERGRAEKCVMTAGGKTSPLRCVALGSSVGTGAAGITAKVIEVGSFDELEKLGPDAIRGNIVFYNVFFDQKKIAPGHAYGETVKYRGRGASYAAKYGAIASIVRSMSSVADDEPHTGNMLYDTAISKTKIPAIAISYIAADRLHEAVAKGEVRVRIETHCRMLEKVPSFNVIGQINGSEKANEYIIAGGHLDSWDNGQGAHDDGAGVVQCIGLMEMYKNLGIRPRHSVRAVAYMNEENGLAGGIAYAAEAKLKQQKHIAAIETDAGGFTPRGFGVDTLNGLYRKVSAWKGLFRPYLIHVIDQGGGGADIGPLEPLGVPCIGFEPDTQRYFDIHHTSQDTFDKVNKRELELGAAAIGALVYLIDTHTE